MNFAATANFLITDRMFTVMKAVPMFGGVDATHAGSSNDHFRRISIPAKDRCKWRVRGDCTIVKALPHGALFLPLVRILRRKPILVLLAHRSEVHKPAATGNSIFMIAFQMLRISLQLSIDYLYLFLYFYVAVCLAGSKKSKRTQVKPKSPSSLRCCRS